MLVNAVNCIGTMGKGVALQFKKRYPLMFEEYKALCEQKLVRPGRPHFYRDAGGVCILNLPTKDDWRQPSRMAYIESGLDWFRSHYASLGIVSAAFPALGCGSGGLDWNEVKLLMLRKLEDLPVDIEIYVPIPKKTPHGGVSHR